jgi:hypothetical protein
MRLPVIVLWAFATLLPMQVAAQSCSVSATFPRTFTVSIDSLWHLTYRCWLDFHSRYRTAAPSVQRAAPQIPQHQSVKVNIVYSFAQASAVRFWPDLLRQIYLTFLFFRPVLMGTEPRPDLERRRWNLHQTFIWKWLRVNEFTIFTGMWIQKESCLNLERV